MLDFPPPDTLDPPFLAPIDCVMDLPYPPSTNRIWRGIGKRVVLSAEYKNWKQQADVAVVANGSWRRRAAMPAHFTALILLDRARRTPRTDVDNRIKAVLDLAQRLALIQDDTLCDEVTARWAPTHEAPSGCRLILRSVAT
jgi:crossover junction endodeoxyribonuclease RusA